MYTLAAMSTFKSRNFWDTKRTLIASAAELPDFETMTREQEADWWDTHDVAEGLFDEGPEVDAEVYEALGILKPKTAS